ncbi:MAG: hypothetical protein ABIW82_04240 [Dokdonella sp.]
MRYFIFALSILLFAATTAPAQLDVANGLSGVSVGVNAPTCQQRIEMPGYPDCCDEPLATL